MRHIALIWLMLALLATASTSQPRHGDLILTVSNYPAWNWAVTIALDPGTGTWTTLAGPVTGDYLACVRMAPNNSDVVVARAASPAYFPCAIQSITPTGISTTLAVIPDGSVEGLELDHDGTWILAGQLWGQSGWPNALWSLAHSNRKVTTLFTEPAAGTSYNDPCIDREQATSPYIIGVYSNATTSPTPKLLKADRQGIVTTLVQGVGEPLREVLGVELDATSGDYVVVDGSPPTVVSRVTPKGGVTSLSTAIRRANGARLNPDRTAWIIENLSGVSLKTHKITADGTVVTMIPLTAFPSSSFALTGVEVYGSRSLVCNQTPPPGTTVTATVQSRHPSAGGRLYQLAASFGRRPGVQMPNGEWLNLDTATDPLFFLSVLTPPPTVFGRFSGFLSANGSATATINIPGGLRGLGVPIFVAGVIHDRTGVVQVTNTHWFLL